MTIRKFIDMIERVETVDTGRIDGRTTRLYENPSRAEFMGLMRSSERTRFLITDDGVFYIWPAMDATHHQMHKYLGNPSCIIGETDKSEDGIVVEVDHEDDVSNNAHFKRLFGALPNLRFLQMAD